MFVCVCVCVCASCVCVCVHTTPTCPYVDRFCTATSKVRVVRSYFCLPFTAESPPPLTVGPAEAGATCQPSMSSTHAAGSTYCIMCVMLYISADTAKHEYTLWAIASCVPVVKCVITRIPYSTFSNKGVCNLKATFSYQPTLRPDTDFYPTYE